MHLYFNNTIMYLKVKKIKDCKFDGNHPNMIFTGYEDEGYVINDSFQVGKQLQLDNRDSWFRTSIITKIDKENQIIYTHNSEYHYAKFENHQEASRCGNSF